jgi:hypothetical protein
MFLRQEESDMPNDSSGSTGVVAIFAIVLMVLVAGFIAWRSGVFGGDDGKRTLDINVDTSGGR